MDKDKLKQQAAEALEYPGVAIDTGDDEKVDPKLVKERTKTLNDNPRDNQ